MIPAFFDTVREVHALCVEFTHFPELDMAFSLRITAARLMLNLSGYEKSTCQTRVRSLHAGGIAGGHRNHRHSRRLGAARGHGEPKARQTRLVHQQSEI